MNNIEMYDYKPDATTLQLREQAPSICQDALLIRYDPENRYWLAWFSGHGVHAYTAGGREIAFWNISNADDHADPAEVMESMADHISANEYYLY